MEIQKEQRSGLKSGFLENSKGLEKHSETRVQAPQGLQTFPRKSRVGHFEFWSQSGPPKWGSTSGRVGEFRIDFSGSNRIWMGTRAPDTGGPPKLKIIEISSGARREGRHL